jgi:hypothetical protein
MFKNYFHLKKPRGKMGDTSKEIDADEFADDIDDMELD